MYTVGDFSSFVERNWGERVEIDLIYDWMGDITQVSPNNVGFPLSDYRKVRFSKHSIDIPKVEEDVLGEVVEALALQTGGKKYTGKLIRAKLSSKSMNIPKSEWPVLYVSDHYVTYERGDGWVEQHAPAGRHAYWWIDEENGTLKSRVGDSPLAEYFKESLNFYRNPLNNKEWLEPFLLSNDTIYWGDRIYYNPVFENVILIKRDDSWEKRQIWYFEDTENGPLLDEYYMMRSLMENAGVI